MQEFGEDFDGPDNVGDGAAAGEIRNNMIETLEDGAGDGKASELLEDFVDKVTRIEVGGDEDVGLASDLIGFGIGSFGMVFVKADAGVNGGVELHFASNEDVAVGESFKGVLDSVDCSVFAATAKSREREHGDARWVGEEFFGGSISLLDDFSELIGCGVFASGHIGEEVEFGVAAHDGEAGESLIGLLGIGVDVHRKVIATSEDDVASRVRDAGDHGVGGAVLDHLAGAMEIGCGEGFDFGPGRGMML